MSFFLSKKSLLQSRIEKRLEEYDHPSKSFFFLIAIATSLASLGLALDNTAVVIGAMVVAPIITPVFGFSLAIIIIKISNAFKSLSSIFLGSITAVIVSAITGYIIKFIEGQNLILTNEIVIRAKPDLFYFLVAILSGLAGAYAYSKPKILSSITGIAISVALLPPLSVIGLSITMQNWHLMEQSIFLYILNLTGIFLGSIISFLVLGLGNVD
ncbi:MAG: TIGR00341 family protein [Candidatus Magasanikbacteria bacterium]|nr:TIGR00341 family protein [Candidatus Magasanikbacteria bacterium]